MKKIFKIFLTAVLVTLVSFTYGMKDANAATGTFTISTSSSVTVGNNFSVTFKATGSKIFYWQFYVSYDTSKLKLVSGSTTIQGEADDATNGTSTVTKTLTFKALNTGSAQVSIARGDADMNIDTNFGTVSYSTVKKTVSIVPVVEKSTNNKLASLSIDNVTLSPVFNADVTSYAIELEPNTTEININASASDGKATVAGTGKVAVVEGLNNLNVVVTAENGSTKTYTIAATVKEPTPIEVTVDGKTYTVVRKKGLYDIPTNFTETTVKMGAEDVLAYTNEKIGTVLGLKNDKGEIGLYLYDAKSNKYTSYKATTISGINLYLKSLDNEKKIPLGYERTSVKVNDLQLTAYNYDDNENNYLIYGVNTITGDEGFYQYDKSTSTVQKFYNNQVSDLQSTANKYLTIIIIVGSAAVAFMVATIILLIKVLRGKGSKSELAQDKFLSKLKKMRTKK